MKEEQNQIMTLHSFHTEEGMKKNIITFWMYSYSLQYYDLQVYIK